jgi:nucleoside-diphosphate-sugar epimerase
MRGDVSQLDEVLRVNVEGTGLLLHHCRRAKAALVMSSTAVYSANEDPWHQYAESDPIGQGVTGQTASTSPASKLGAESVARFCARAYDLPVVIARLNTFTGTTNSFPAIHIGAVLDGRPMVAPHDPSPHSPIHLDDMKAQLEAMLDAASTPALVTNWCGDQVVTAQDWTRLASEWSGLEGQLLVRSQPGAPTGACADPTRRRAITGPCRTDFETSFRTMFDAMVEARS